MNTCIDYMSISELDSLVQARVGAAHRDVFSPRKQKGHSPSEKGTDGPSSTRSQSTSRRTSYAEKAVANLKGTQSCSGPPAEPANRFLFESRQELQPAVDLQGTVLRWLLGAEDRYAGGYISEHGAQQEQGTQQSEKHHSSIQSQVLEDYPSLLGYAVYQLFTHARLADATMCDPQSIIDRLSDRETWTRWLALREDLPLTTTLAEYADQQGLSSWIPKLAKQAASKEEQPLFVDDSAVKETMDDPNAQYYQSATRHRYSRRRSGSVASFSSAGNHTGSLRGGTPSPHVQLSSQDVRPQFPSDAIR
jgi:hypothetical protein